jgi:hypothetical protein
MRMFPKTRTDLDQQTPFGGPNPVSITATFSPYLQTRSDQPLLKSGGATYSTTLNPTKDPPDDQRGGGPAETGERLLGVLTNRRVGHHLT